MSTHIKPLEGRSHFCLFPTLALLDEEMTSASRLVLGLLVSHASKTGFVGGKTGLSQETLAREAGYFSKGKPDHIRISHTIIHLVNLGYVINNGQIDFNCPNTYQITTPNCVDGVITRPTVINRKTKKSTQLPDSTARGGSFKPLAADIAKSKIASDKLIAELDDLDDLDETHDIKPHVSTIDSKPISENVDESEFVDEDADYEYTENDLRIDNQNFYDFGIPSTIPEDVYRKFRQNPPRSDTRF